MENLVARTVLPIARSVRDLFYENTQTRERFCFNCFTSTNYPLANQRMSTLRSIINFRRSAYLHRLLYDLNIHTSRLNVQNLLRHNYRFLANALKRGSRRYNRKFFD